MEHPPKQGLKREKQASRQTQEERFNGTSTKTRIETALPIGVTKMAGEVLMEHPPKQGLKQLGKSVRSDDWEWVLMEHPPKQGLKHHQPESGVVIEIGFNGTSTKTRIETFQDNLPPSDHKPGF